MDEVRRIATGISTLEYAGSVYMTELLPEESWKIENDLGYTVIVISHPNRPPITIGGAVPEGHDTISFQSAHPEAGGVRTIFIQREAIQMSEVLQYKRGDVIMFTSGDHSDYRVRGIVVAVSDLDLPELVKEFRSETGRSIWDAAKDDFFAWLLSKGRALPVAYSEEDLDYYAEWTD